MRKTLSCLCVAVVAVAAGPTVLKDYPITSLEGVISRTGVTLNRTLTTDRNGSLQIVARGPRTVHLFETGPIDVENARLIYQAKLRTLNVKGDAYLEMLCHFPGRGEFFSRGLQYALSGTNDWVSVETMFFLRKGENPDNIKLNLVFTGKGMAWIDEIKLLKAPLE